MLGRELTLSYNGVPVVHDAQIELLPGRITALIGPNGSGKSTLLRSLARLHAADAGRILLPATATGVADGPDSHGPDSDRPDSDRPDSGGPDRWIDALSLSNRDFATRVTLLAQSRPTPSGLSVREVVEFGRHPYRGRWVRGDADGAAIIDRALELTGVADLADRPIDRLSGGQLQRVWLATCLAQDTGILLLDEPTTYLDLRYQMELLDLIRDLSEVHGVTVGVVLHDLDQAALIADHVVLLAEGRVLAAGSPLSVYSTELLSSAYGIRVDIDVDDETGLIRTRPIGRHTARPRTIERVPAVA